MRDKMHVTLEFLEQVPIQGLDTIFMAESLFRWTVVRFCNEDWIMEMVTMQSTSLHLIRPMKSSKEATTSSVLFGTTKVRGGRLMSVDQASDYCEETIFFPFLGGLYE